MDLKTTTHSKKRKIRKQSNTSKESQYRSVSEGTKRNQQKKNVSRRSSSSSSAVSLDVRCACQYYQSDSLLPERINPVGTRPNSRISNNHNIFFRDHEYEPVNPPSEEMILDYPPKVQSSSSSHQIKIIEPQKSSSLSSNTSLERQCIGAQDEAQDLSQRKGDIQDAVLTSQQLQDQIEEQYLTNKSLETQEYLSSQNTPIDDTSKAKQESLQNEKTEIEEQQGRKFNEAFKHQAVALKVQAGKLKSKFQNMKKPNLSLPQKPNFKMPKLGDHSKIHLPKFKKNKEKCSWQEQRQFSTESNVGDVKRHFDFSTFPKLFDRSKKGRKGSLNDFDASPSSNSKIEEQIISQPEFATVPRASKRKASMGSKWANKFKDIDYADEELKTSDKDIRPHSVRISLHGDEEDIPEDGSHKRYNEDIDIDEDFERENQEIHQVSPFASESLKRWEHGEFHEGPSEFKSSHQNILQVTDLDEPQTPPHSNPLHSSGSLSDHRHGVIEEIDSDEFFLREKGISQEDIEVGRYLTSEIREAFRNPLSLSQSARIELFNGESDQSIQEPPPRKKPPRKQKRKKTPHVSNENLKYDRDSVTEIEEYQNEEVRSYPPPPFRPTRRSKSKKLRNEKEVNDKILIQEITQIDNENYNIEEQLTAIESEILPDNILSSDEINHLDQMYEHEKIEGSDQPKITTTYTEYNKKEFENVDNRPMPPPRKHKSLKSLNISEHDSIFEDSTAYKDTPVQEVIEYRGEHEYIIPTPEPPLRSRKTRSRSLSQIEDDRTSKEAESIVSENLVPAVEQVCIKDIRDSSGYAIIDKQKPREPPLPPSRFPTTPPRRRKNKNIEQTKLTTETKFFTVPRLQQSNPPERPSRNYSTLGTPTKPTRRISLSASNLNNVNKENVDSSQYTEINEEPVKRLQSGEIVQKMRTRPLPAPPRPPRRNRDSRDVLQDITNNFNISDFEVNKERNEEIEVSTQTEPLPDDFICEEVTQEKTDRIIKPSDEKKLGVSNQGESFEETVTHAALVVQALDKVKILPYSELTRQQNPTAQERLIPTRIQDSDEETSEIPEEFKHLKSPELLTQQQKPVNSHSIDGSLEIEFLKAQKLQVTDLDVDKLRVNHLETNKIIASEIEATSIEVDEINSRSKNLIVSGIELPPHLLQELVNKLKSLAVQQSSQCDQNISQETESGISTLKEPYFQELPSKKEEKHDYYNQENASTDQVIHVTGNRINSSLEENQNVTEDAEHVQNLENQQIEDISEIPKRPPRKSSVVSTSVTQEIEENNQVNLTVASSNYSASASSLQSCSETPSTKGSILIQEEPFHRLPQSEYCESQPPASFFALRSQPYSEILTEVFPMPPRRKRHFRAPLLTHSSSEDNPSPSRRQKSTEQSIPELAGQLTRACACSAEAAIRRLIIYFSDNVFNNKDGKQDAHIMVMLLLVLIAGILLLTGEPKIIEHHHHWEFFNPPKDL